MAVLYITEFVGMGGDRNAHMIPVTQQPPIAEQTVSIGASSLQSSAFNNSTGIVRLHTDAICSVEFGTNPTATATKARMAANQTEYFTVPQGQSYMVAVITNS
ncbi:MAG: hypothetical protein KGI25_07955 [Thaumarchaeota archaeon]|nr:hypothetical protein [Nitrososphaerota archaeon]